MHRRPWSRERRRTMLRSQPRFFKVAVEAAVYILCSATFIWFAYGNAVDVAAGMRAFLHCRGASSARRREKREERTGWRIKQRGSCKSRVEARDTSLALSRFGSANGRHRDWSRASLWPSSSSLPSELWSWSTLRICLEFLETICPAATSATLPRVLRF